MKAIRWITKMRADGFIMSAAAESIGLKSNFRPGNKFTNARSVESISRRKIFGWQGRKGRFSSMAASTGRKTVGVSRGLMMLCDTCYAQVIADKLTDEKNFVANADLLFDTICFGCTDINRPLIDDMAGSGE
jgi:hypothetical protein